LKTDDLIAMLANRVHAIDPRIAARRYLIAIAVGGVAAIALLVTALGINPGLAHEAVVPMFWVREAYCLGLGALAIAAVVRLARPGVPLGRLGMAVPVPLIVMWLLAAIALFNAPAEGRVPLLLGGSAIVCPFRIAVISSPLLVAFIWALRGFAPTRLRFTGAVAGFAAGALGALVYTLHCPELAAPFLGVWYVLGMLIPTLIGASLGPRLLRW
jgi:hypothetical protein